MYICLYLLLYLCIQVSYVLSENCRQPIAKQNVYGFYFCDSKYLRLDVPNFTRKNIYQVSKYDKNQLTDNLLLYFYRKKYLYACEAIYYFIGTDINAHIHSPFYLYF